MRGDEPKEDGSGQETGREEGKETISAGTVGQDRCRWARTGSARGRQSGVFSLLAMVDFLLFLFYYFIFWLGPVTWDAGLGIKFRPGWRRESEENERRRIIRCEFGSDWEVECGSGRRERRECQLSTRVSIKGRSWRFGSYANVLFFETYSK